MFQNHTTKGKEDESHAEEGETERKKIYHYPTGITIANPSLKPKVGAQKNQGWERERDSSE